MLSRILFRSTDPVLSFSFSASALKLFSSSSYSLSTWLGSRSQGPSSLTIPTGYSSPTTVSERDPPENMVSLDEACAPSG